MNASAKKPVVTVNDTEALRYAGIMGHPFAVTCDSDEIGNRSVLGECNDRETALKWAAGAARFGVNANGRAWRKTSTGWAAVKP